MTPQITILIDSSFALAVTGAALLWPPLALLVAAFYLAAQAVIADRRTPAAE